MDRELLGSLICLGGGVTSLVLAFVFALSGAFVALAVVGAGVFVAGLVLALISLIEHQRSAATALVVVHGSGVFLAFMLVLGVFR